MFPLLGLLSALATAQETADTPAPSSASPDSASPAADPWDKVGWGWGGVPAVAYNSDDGFGGGILASIYRYNGDARPYKWASTVLLYVTTKQVHTHRVEFDFIEVGDKPLRLTTRVEFAATRSANYCGTNPTLFCDEAMAITQADNLGLSGAARAEAIDKYNKVRLIQPNAFVSGRYAIDPMPHRVELMLAWWGQYLIPGDFQDHAPFAHSQYGADFPGGEQGMSSTLQAAVMFDNRDNEPAPTSGYWVEASLRGGTPYWGSDWSWFGYNTTWRGYVPFTEGKRLIGTARVVADGIVGDIPFFVQTRMGGAQIYEAFGGQRAGRGIRLRGLTGKVRFLAQPELRWTFSSFSVSKAKVDLTAIFFSDSAYLAQDWQNLDQHRLAITEGVGMRFAFNKNFIIRTDVGFSALEDFSPGIYIDVGNLW